MTFEDKVVKSYVPKETSLRDVAKMYNTNHHRVKRILDANSIPIVKANRKPSSEATRRKISVSSMGRKSWSSGKKMSAESVYKNMLSHLRFEVPISWLMQHDDLEKLKFLNRAITNRDGRWGDFGNYDYIAYIEKFYTEEQFNHLYNKWLENTSDKYMKPSIDHIIPKASGGTNAIENLQFLSWFENRCKNDITQEDWVLMKTKLKDYLI